MSQPVQQVAQQHYEQQVSLAARIAAEVAALWATLSLTNLGESWLGGIGTRITALVASGQLLAARSADPYVAAALSAQGVEAGAVAQVVPTAFAAVASDGRPLESLLFEPVVAARTAISQGVELPQAKAVGAVHMDTIVRTQIADAGRLADHVAIVARPRIDGYVRMLDPPSCSRCVILAGRWYSWSAGFKRHYRCDCRAIPASEDAAGDLRTDPKLYFESLSEADQKRVFTNAGAQAIRDGADIFQVVNARKGLYEAGGKKLTRVGTSKKRPVRLTTEQIYREAAGSRDEALRLLRLHGYIR